MSINLNRLVTASFIAVFGLMLARAIETGNTLLIVINSLIILIDILLVSIESKGDKK
ncbi:hypothetical protein NX029_26300 [Cytobacillus firmus]|nr:hypothetical protein [Cytobacillus firmus]